MPSSDSAEESSQSSASRSTDSGRSSDLDHGSASIDVAAREDPDASEGITAPSKCGTGPVFPLEIIGMIATHLGGQALRNLAPAKCRLPLGLRHVEELESSFGIGHIPSWAECYLLETCSNVKSIEIRGNDTHLIVCLAKRGWRSWRSLEKIRVTYSGDVCASVLDMCSPSDAFPQIKHLEINIDISTLAPLHRLMPNLETFRLVAKFVVFHARHFEVRDMARANAAFRPRRASIEAWIEGGEEDPESWLLRSGFIEELSAHALSSRALLRGVLGSLKILHVEDQLGLGCRDPAEVEELERALAGIEDVDASLYVDKCFSPSEAPLLALRAVAAEMDLWTRFAGVRNRYPCNDDEIAGEKNIAVARKLLADAIESREKLAETSKKLKAFRPGPFSAV
ncbi:hypothetical protein DFJ74DRAFT_707912 [Hyaloraphidium curvatum]|nr:hypothetical protein DFJ74DRAFT_707912 [Hyaloraphidium curvatum]